jgi:hypothetical protein
MSTETVVALLLWSLLLMFLALFIGAVAETHRGYGSSPRARKKPPPRGSGRGLDA